MKRPKRKEAPDSTIFLAKKNEEWKKFSFRSAANDGIDCGDKQCYVEYRVLPDCYIILETNRTNCIIPCIMDGCDTELHHFIPCPIWNCEPFTTTTSSTTTSSTSTTETPRPTPIKPSQMSPLIYTSVVLNIVFGAILIAYLVVKCRERISATFARLRAPETPESLESPEPIQPPDPNQHFSLGENNSGNESDTSDSERRPLLPKVNTSNVIVAQVSANNAVIAHGSLDHGHDNLALDIEPQPSTSNWHEISLASGSSGTCLENRSIAPENRTDVTSLNEPQPLNSEVKRTEKPIFMLMKTFRKK